MLIWRHGRANAKPSEKKIKKNILMFVSNAKILAFEFQTCSQVYTTHIAKVTLIKKKSCMYRKHIHIL